MRILPKIITFIQTKKVAREDKHLSRYVSIDESLSSDIFEQLHSARKVIANYAKKKGITVEIADSERRVTSEIFEFDQDERIAKRAAKGNLDIIVRPIKSVKTHNNDILISICRKIKKDVNQITTYKPDKNHEYQDNFLRTVYRNIENCVKNLNNKV